MNPFVYGRVVSKGDFCPRPELEKQLRSHVLSDQNVLVEGERRVGKTSLICETARKIKKHRLLYVDLMEIKDTDELCRRIIKSFFSPSNKDSFFHGLFKNLARLKPVLSYDPLTGLPTLTFAADTPLRPDSLEEILDCISRHRSKDKLIVVFDEFQDILQISEASVVLSILRSKIQFQKEITYIFSGSIRNKMNDIFNNPDSPFFKSAIIMDVGPLPDDAFSEFITNKFKQGGRNVTAETLEKVFEIAQENPGDIQQCCAAIWDCSSEGDTVDASWIPRALQRIFGMELKGYEATLGRISAQQQHCLVALARLGGVSPLASLFLKFTGISQPGSVKKALQRLVDLKILFTIKNEYKFTNPYFKAWLIAENI